MSWLSDGSMGDRVFSFDDLIARAAEPVLQQLVGRHVVRLLARMDPALSQPENLRQIALGLHTPAEMLLNASTRAELMNLLPRAEAELLARRLELSTDDAYAVLGDLRIRRGTRKQHELLDFFSIPDPVDDSGFV